MSATTRLDFGGQRTVVGFLGPTKNATAAAHPARALFRANEVVTTLTDAVLRLAAFHFQRTAHELSRTTEAL
jgi:hypothetical protein